MTDWARDSGADVAAARRDSDVAFAAWRGAADAYHALVKAGRAHEVPARWQAWALEAAHAHAELLWGAAERADRRARALEESWRGLCASVVKAGAK